MNSGRKEGQQIEGQQKEDFIQIKKLYKLFGSDPDAHLQMVLEGASKAKVLEKTGHTLGLKDINLSIKRGETFVIMGLSGSGKSTLIRHFNRLIEPSSGSIFVDGQDVTLLDEKSLKSFRRTKMAMVFQHFGLMPHKTVLDNVAFGLKVQNVSRQERTECAQRWLRAVGLEGYESMYPAQLSGGQQQRVGLARALCTDPDVLLMDEAFSALDPLIRSEMQDQLIELQSKLQKTIVFITHDLDEALRVGDRIAILKDGELVQVGAPSEILLNPVNEYVEAFVKDVNRARALTVENVMKAPANRITARSVGEALEQMKTFSGDIGYVVGESGYLGAVRKQTLEDAAGSHSGSAPLTREMCEQAVEVSPDAYLEEVIPDTLDTDYPLPVVSSEGKLKGLLSRSGLAKILGR
jgi:glycine betaine/proline transport system ATP-binding protein